MYLYCPTVSGIGVVYNCAVLRDGTVFAVTLAAWITTFFTLTLATNVVCTCKSRSPYIPPAQSLTLPRSHCSSDLVHHQESGALLWPTNPPSCCHCRRRVGRHLLCVLHHHPRCLPPRQQCAVPSHRWHVPHYQHRLQLDHRAHCPGVRLSLSRHLSMLNRFPPAVSLMVATLACKRVNTPPLVLLIPPAPTAPTTDIPPNSP